MRTRFSRLSLLWKILLSTSVAVTVLFAITGEIVLSHITRTMTDSAKNEVQASFRAYTSIWKSRVGLLSDVSRVISQMSDFKRAFGTNDRATIEDSAGELWSKISDADAIFMATDPLGEVKASLGGRTTLTLPKEIVQAAADCFPQQTSGFFAQDGELYHLSVTPVYVESTHEDKALMGALVAGYHVDGKMAQRLRDDTGGGSEFIFIAPEASKVISTLNPRATAAVIQSIGHAKGNDLVSDGVLQYAWYEDPLLDLSGHKVGSLRILRSFEDAPRRLSTGGGSP